jgi:hypothetical protein
MPRSQQSSTPESKGSGTGPVRGRTNSTPSLNPPNLEIVLAFTQDILDKKYDLYHWCESKIASLLTLDSILLGGLFLVITTHGHFANPVDYWLIASTAAILLASLSVALVHIMPAMNSGLTSGKNPRTVIGTAKYESNASYLADLRQIDMARVIELNAEQARGMNKNIMRNQRAIKIAALLTLAAIVPLLIVVGRISA